MSVSASDDLEATSRCGSFDANPDWRSIDQVDNGIPSTSPPYYDSDDDDDDGPKPSQLYGRHTWKIDNFQTIKRRELRGDVFDVGGYKWYILLYPQGCDVCNHLSLFLCVANHDKLLPGWSHLAQFSIAVVNKDPKKSKYSDTLHRFWKKEHDWGWKKFMELSKVNDGFIDDDETLTIKAQVQVIRERTNGPFRCLEMHYRRELVRVYLSNVEQVCRHFVEERKNKLSNLVLDKNKWSSFRAFWSGIDRISKRRITRDRTESVLKLLVKHFFIEKEVTSTLVMDALSTGLKVLEWQSRGDNLRLALRIPGFDGMPQPLVRIDEDMFVLADDIINLIERVASEPALRHKEDKYAQTAKKDGSCGEDAHKDSIEFDERRLTELGRRTMEIFVLGHVFSRIEIAYQEAVALKRQEELIREEELFGSSSDLRGKSGGSGTNKDKRSSKKKQTKQKRNGRKEAKGKTKDFTLDGKLVDNSTESELMIDNKPEDTSDLSDNEDLKPEPAQSDSNEKSKAEETMHPSVDIKMQEFTPGNSRRRRLSKGGSRRNTKEAVNQFSGTNGGAIAGTSSPPPDVPTHSGRYCGSYRGPRSESENLVVSLKDRIKLLQQRLVEVEDSLLKKFNAKELGEVFSKTESGNESASASASASSSSSPMKNPNKSSSNPSSNLLTQESPKRILENISPADKPSEPIKEASLKDSVTINSVVTNRSQVNGALDSSSSSKTDSQKQKQKQITKEKSGNAPAGSSSTGNYTSPITANVTPRQKPAKQPVSNATSAPISTHAPQSYRNAITGSNNPAVMPSQHAPVVVPPEHGGLRFGTVTIETLNGDEQHEPSHLESCVSSSSVERLELHEEEPGKSTTEEEAGPEIEIEIEASSCLSSFQQSGLVPDEFPHLDIINDLLEEDPNNGYNHSFFSRQYSLPDRPSPSPSADVSPSWACPPEAYYESFPRAAYTSFGTPQVNTLAYSDSQMEMLRSQYAYLRANSLAFVPGNGLNVGDGNGYTMYRDRLGEYSASLASGGVSNGHSTYYHGSGPNGNMGSLQSLD